ncbi:MAG: hypothetical protein N7Q72_06800 [Spiroplasma sp. Tabriz.8]|nr:hypothetical protein [Spiroplasma sp. Tabriz.8]
MRINMSARRRKKKKKRRERERERERERAWQENGDKKWTSLARNIHQIPH